MPTNTAGLSRIHDEGQFQQERWGPLTCWSALLVASWEFLAHTPAVYTRIVSNASSIPTRSSSQGTAVHPRDESPDSYPHFTNKGGLSVHKRMRTAEALSLFTTRSEQRCACQAAPLFFLCKMWVRIRLRKQGSFSDVEKTTTDISFFQTSKRKGS